MFMNDWHKSPLNWCKFDSMEYLDLSIKNFDNFIRLHMGDYNSKAPKWPVSLCCQAFFFELVAARFYVSVEAITRASHLTNREQYHMS